MLPFNNNNLLPLSWFKQQRSAGTAVFNEEHQYWSVFGHEGVKNIHTDFEHFSSQIQPPSDDSPIDSSILRTDPPRHKLMRATVARAFTSRVIEQMESSIERLAGELLDQAGSAGRLDIVSGIANPLPVTVIAEMMGIPQGDRELFKKWSDDLVGNDPARQMQCQEEMALYFKDILKSRRAQPGNDLITALIEANVGGGTLSEIELIGFCILLLVAGNETTSNLISSSILCLESAPEAWEQLLKDNSLIPSAIEETLRYCSPVQILERRVKADMQWAGNPFKEGQLVLTYIGSANHDERVFDEPERFNIHRRPNPHLAFGHGIHFCLGAVLARLEARIALKALLNRLPRLRRTDNQPLERLDSSMMFGLKRFIIENAVR
ncbi:cytochrome P450 [Paenibacillus nasutitermitis]|uniref:Cytochrome P450 YjiB n=1 Tax=Paenibacillus nasutitermitis TaxID=1652958 RepID=A0A916YRZ5_9BACL|nr:cytochrome P450 [Paenibacillus nasutitermitis]GGD58665.1 putative cytochrome P450 YjiB [Paenibacillus nasutitermitis]